MMLRGLSIGSQGVGTSTQQPADQNGHEVAARLLRLVVTAPTSVGALALEVALKSCSEVEESTSARTLPASLDGSPKLAGLLPPEVRVIWMANISLCEGRGKRRTLSLKTVGSSNLTWTVCSGATGNVTCLSVTAAFLGVC